jgi:two-component system cell cycle response regulator CpdR
MEWLSGSSTVKGGSNNAAGPADSSAEIVIVGVDAPVAIPYPGSATVWGADPRLSTVSGMSRHGGGDETTAPKAGVELPLVYQIVPLWDQRFDSRTRNRPMKILLAEDDNDMRRFLAKALQNAGYDVLSFDNGLSAYNRLREEPFELLLTDIVMPEMDGIELARRATELDPDIKVMFITGFAAVALNPDSKAPKDAKVLSKPFHLRDLVNEVEKLLAA